ncbi:MAG: N-acetyl-gamma-glutamyl-phosphate reductase [Proteobacteria bacterium]|nr:MAG: N-acetyl-gamma-glutamyl-phosphate reductase [Pseudomonadota bacterium]
MADKVKRVALIGARGYTGAELIKLIDDHPGFELAVVSSRALAGQPLTTVVPSVRRDLDFVTLTPDRVASQPCFDVWVLALPNGVSPDWVAAIDAHQPDAIVIDLSADHRFDDAWTYGLPEMRRDAILTAKRVANPGCYATGAQLALLPLVDRLQGVANVFGVSGYSGAGTTPSPKNDPDVLQDNLIPYKLVGHIHESEIRWQLGHPVYFMPHVAPFYRGITLTISMTLSEGLTRDDLVALYRKRYAYEPMVHVDDGVPLVRDASLRHGATIGGITADAAERHAVVVATLDNLLKGAATQALQNMNLTCGYDELAGIRARLARTT